MFNNKKNHGFLVPHKTEVFRGKKGIVKIIEAAIAIFMLLGFTTILLVSQIQKPNLREQAYQISHQILREIAENYTIRNDILKENLASTDAYIEKRLAQFPFMYSTSVCKPDQSCLCSNCPGDIEIYADDMIISTNLSDYIPMKLSLFMWIPPGLGGAKIIPPGCTSVCSNLAQECNSENTAYRICGDYNSDGCYEWNTYADCQPGQTCENGQCVGEVFIIIEPEPEVPGCSNLCPTPGATQCLGSSVQTCGDYSVPADGCWEWGGTTACPLGCENGACKSATCTAQYVCISSKQRHYQNTDCTFGATENAPLCTKQSGVCSGSTKSCSSGNWIDCSDADYLLWNSYYGPEGTSWNNCGDTRDNDCNGKCDESGCGTLPPEPNCPLM